ncbi:hypothetical protein [Aureimonas leprariae]|uniref:Uncharacterized protein n=1 Tax=Plantimonas leprariae TaxID=2615207 RepID=A0A7V7TXV2_9HYPH|nr:hypothetical protein [Aureimonas leprariae]KAB0681490.1 hypothetical protein F6X38_06310 [Aureimonas leprariae]
MSEQALSEGAKAFKSGVHRTANPFDPSSEDWMCWRDGFDQAKAVAERVAGTVPAMPAVAAIAAD